MNRKCCIQRIILNMLIFVILITNCIVTVDSWAETETLHYLWDIDINTMDVQQIHDYLDQEKGILSSIVWNYDRENHNSLNSSDDQELSLWGEQFSIHYCEYKRYNTIFLDFGNIRDEEYVWNICTKVIEKYDAPNLMYYELYNRTDIDWNANINTPMFHDLYLVDDISFIEIDNTLRQWEYFESSDYYWGQIDVYLWIDNVEIHIKHCANSSYTVFVKYYSLIPNKEVEELHETKNQGNYIDEGL